MDKSVKGKNKAKQDIDTKVRLIRRLAEEIADTLDGMDTKDVDSLGLYEYERPTKTGGCTRYEFFYGARIIDHLRKYFNDEQWAQWEGYHDEEKKND